MAPVLLTAPTHLLLRIGYPPDPLAWPPPPYRGGGRFDDPHDEYGVIYAALDRRCCFLETLDAFRPDSVLQRRLLAMGADVAALDLGLIPDRYLDRLIVTFRVETDRRFVDLRSSTPATAVALSQEPTIAALLPTLGYGRRFKPGDLVGSDRHLTRAIGRWVFEQGYAGVVYSSSHDTDRSCWAIFDRVTLIPVGSPTPITPDDLDLLAVAALFGLTPPDRDPRARLRRRR